MAESDLVEKLRAPANWLRQDKGEQWKDAVNRYDRAPFEAAARIERLEAALRKIDEACSNPGKWSEVVMERIIERVQEIARAALGEKP